MSDLELPHFPCRVVYVWTSIFLGMVIYTFMEDWDSENSDLAEKKEN